MDAWSLYAAQATSQPPAVAVAMLNAVVEAFPTAGNKWRALADATDRLGDKAATTRVYERGVVTARASVDLWRAYTAHAAAELPHAAATAVFEAAVHAVGLDPGAHPLWVAFIDHVRAAPAHSTVADSHKRDALRRAFQRAVRAPVAHLDTLWRDYETFELSSTTNKDLARGILGEITPAHVAARAEHRARVARRKTVASAYGGNLTSGAAELSPPAVGARPEDVERARAWRRYIASEARNPHGLEAAELVERVVAAYEAALGAMYRSAVLWLDAIDYMATTAKDRGRAIKMLDRSIKPRAIPNTHLRPTDAWSSFGLGTWGGWWLAEGLPGGMHAAASWANGWARTVHPSVLRRSSRVSAARRFCQSDRVADLLCGDVVVSRRWLVGIWLLGCLFFVTCFPIRSVVRLSISSFFSPCLFPCRSAGPAGLSGAASGSSGTIGTSRRHGWCPRCV